MTKLKGERNAALDAQMDECRELLAEVRGATKDLHTATRVAREVFPLLAAEHAHAAMDEAITQATNAGVVKLAETVERAVCAAEASVYKRFEELVNLLTTGNKEGRSQAAGGTAQPNVDEAMLLNFLRRQHFGGLR